MTFDLNAVTAGVTGANDTKYPLCPAGEFAATIKSQEGRQVQTERGLAIVVDITWTIQDEDVKKEMGLDSPTVRQSLWLDVDAANKLDTGPQKNVRLGRLREALSLNDPSKEFSFDDLLGQMAMVTIGHTADKKDAEIIYANVTKVGTI